VKVKSRLVCVVRWLSWVCHPWYLALLISSFVALQRGICVTFMGGFSAGYDAVAIPPYRHPVYKSPSHPTTQPPILPQSNHSGGCCFVLSCLRQKKVSIVFGPRIIDTPQRWAVHSWSLKQVGVKESH